MRYFKSIFIFGLVLLFGSTAMAAQKKASSCIECHKKVTPGIVQQHLDGKMGKKGIDCSACHGTAHNKMDDAKLAKMPTPETCAGCHSKQADQFKAGKHNLAWIASSSMPMMGHQPKAVAGEGYKGCSSCHKIGAKSDAEKGQIRYGHAQCDSCHTRHSFKKSEAQDPRACQTCHMSGGDHNVMTSWGFLALRLPEDDKDWLNDRVTILQALGVLDDKGNPTARLDLVKAGKVARLTKEEFQKERDKMTVICAKCHGASYAKGQLDAADMVVKDMDKVMAEAIRVVQGLYKDGVLVKPADWTMAPDLLQFYEAKSAIEQDLYVMFLEYRMRTFEGAFHMNPDYMHWYGWAPMKETLQKIKDEAAKLRAEKAVAAAH